MRRVLAILIGLGSATLALCAGQGTVTRLAPEQGLPATPFLMTNQTAFTSAVTVHAVEEQLPAGWTASSVSHSGQFDPGSRKIKWGPFFDATPRALSCTVTPGAATGVFSFSGNASFDGSDSPIGGSASIRILTAAEANDATAVLPEFFSPGVALEFKIFVHPVANVVGYAVEDSLPAGWTASGFNEGGAQVGGKLKWGPFFDATARELRCQLVPPGSAASVVTFSGVASFDGADVPISGARKIKPLLSKLERSIPIFYSGGVAFDSVVAATPAPGVSVYSVAETLPANWTADTISDGGAFDAAQRTVKWGPFFDATQRTLTFRVHPPANADAPAGLSGQGAFDNNLILTAGPSLIFPQTGSALRVLPSKVGLLETIVLSNIVTPKPGSISWAVQDSVPTGWSASNISDGGVFDSATRMVKWGPFFDDTPRTLTCNLVSDFVPGTAQFSGTASFDGVAFAITGNSSVAVEAPPPAVSVALRDLPNSVRPGSPFVLSNLVSPANFIGVYALEEHVPAGWSASEISDGGAYDSRNGLVKWGPFFDATVRTLTCRLTSPLSATGSIAFTGHASFDGLDVNVTGDGSLTMAASPNRSPVALSDTFTRLIDRPLSVSVSRLLINDSDPDNDSLTVIAVSSLSARGIAVALNAGIVSYAPALGFNEIDSFSYTIRDSDGATATATVTIQPPPAGFGQNIISIDLGVSGALVVFGGVPGFSYDIQAATTLSPPNWSTLLRRTADSIGRFQILDAGALTSPQRFYRTLYVE
jgi:hypothetical protein